MPLLKRNQLEKVVAPESLKDSEEVFFCELSKEVFRNYDDYFERMMMFNSTIWTCSLTSRPNLTYIEALESEKKARKTLKDFIPEIKAPALYIASLTKLSSISDMVDEVFKYLDIRYFKNETVLALETSKDIKMGTRECVVLEVLHPPNSSSQQCDPSKITYRVKRVNADGKTANTPWLVSGDQMYRKRGALSKERLKLFLKQCVECSNECAMQLKIKDDCFKKYVTDMNVKKFSDLFVGKEPTFETSKALLGRMKKSQTLKEKKKKSPDASSKQPSISKYLTKEKTESNKLAKEASDAAAKEKTKNLKEEMERLAKEKIEREAERQRQVVKQRELIQAAVKNLNLIKDDLELQDQKLLPRMKPVSTIISSKYFGDALMVLEFMHSFSSALEDKDKFPQGYSLQLLERSLVCREVAGPLSDLLQVLLGTIFSLQIEEEQEVRIKYAAIDSIPETDEINKKIRLATKAAGWSEKFFSMSLSEMPMDATTISELLRRHFLMSGAKVDENAARWRYQQRGGYENLDDPGFILRLNQPHILRALEQYTIYQMPIGDILKVLVCLVSQILTYSTVRDTTEERLQTSYKARQNIKNLIAAERRRENLLVIEKKDLTEEVKKTVKAFEGKDDERVALEQKLTKELEEKIRHVNDQSERAKKVFSKTLDENLQDLFAYQLFLGVDRAYRSYWLFESLPGLFIQHQPFGGRCFENPVQNINELANCTQSERYHVIKQMVNAPDKENKIDNFIESKKINGTASTKLLQKNDNEAAIMLNGSANDSITQKDLFMCTGEKNHCPVHTIDSNLVAWSYLHTEDELNALIASLNPRGLREKLLKENLESEKELIFNHIKNCPVEILQFTEDKRKDKLKQLMEIKQYAKNVTFSPELEIGLSIELTLADNILEMEMNITTGHLGKIQVDDLEAWRLAIQNRGYDMQCKELRWGVNNEHCEGKNKKNNEIPVDGDDESGNELGDTKALDLDETVEDGISLHESTEIRTKVHNYASALLQIGQSVDSSFFKPPFGAARDLKDKAAQEKIINDGKVKLQLWATALMKATSYSQVYLQYNILHDAIKWSKSSLNATCIFCRRKNDSEKMLLCDGCNCGKHLYCFKPKLTKVPDTDWFCEKCRPVQKVDKKPAKKKREIFQKIEESSDDDDISSNDEEESATESDDSDISIESGICDACKRSCSKIIRCKDCFMGVHLKCTVPKMDPNKRTWRCQRCKTEKKKARKSGAKPTTAATNKKPTIQVTCTDDEEDDEEMTDEDEVIVAKKPRTEKKLSLTRFEQKPAPAIVLEKKKTSKRSLPVSDDESSSAASSRRNSQRDDAARASSSQRNSRHKKEEDPLKLTNGNSRRNSRRVEEDDQDSKKRGSSSGRRSRRAEDEYILDTVVLHNLLVEIGKHKDSWPFDRPVNKQEVPDYYAVIKKPMDFAKVKSKLNLGEYSSNYDIMNDIQLIFQNCDLYNTSESDIYKSGVRLETFIQKRCADLNIPFRPSDMIASDDSSSSQKTKKQKTH